MKKMINQEKIEGRVYQHDLTIKTVQNQASANYGKPFITGNLDVAVDEEGLNVVTVHFTYVSEATKSGAKNATYTALAKIIHEGKAWITDGKDAATKVKVDTSLALNDFYGQDDTLISVKRNEGGFVTIVNELCKPEDRNNFQVDMVITSVKKVEADPEHNIEEPYVTIRGAVFNYKNDLLPVDFVVKNDIGMKYFEGLEISNSAPVFTKVWGKINCVTVAVPRVEESAFGEAAVKTYERKTKEWVITGAAKFPYDFGDETVLTAEELTKAMQNREVYLADIKKANEEYKASRAASPAPTATPVATAAKGSFTF